MQIKALPCELPGESGLPLSRYSRQDLVDEIKRRGIVAEISGSTIWRRLDEDAIRPWRTGMFGAPRVFGRCDSTTGIEYFDKLVKQVMIEEPYPTARRVFWIVDNGSSHRGAVSVKRSEGRSRISP